MPTWIEKRLIASVPRSSIPMNSTWFSSGIAPKLGAWASKSLAIRVG